MSDNNRAADDERSMATKRVHSAPKLRSTCDRCTLLKVRCDKQKPRCERCESANASCVYGPYKWKGRPSASAKSTSISSSISSTPVESNITVTSAAGPMNSTSLSDIWDSTVMATAQVLPPASFDLEPRAFSVPMDFQDAPMGLEWDGLMPSADVGNLDGWYARFMDVDQDAREDGSGSSTSGSGSHSSSGNQMFGSGRASASPPLSRSNPLSRVGSASSDLASAGSTASFRLRSNSPPSSRGGAPTNCQCSRVVFNVLQDTYQAELGIKSSSGKGNNGYFGAAVSALGCTGAVNGLSRSDQIVKISRAAVQHMEQLLSCDCAASGQNPTLLFLVAALSSKLLVWYRDVFAAVSQQSQSQSQSPLDPGLGSMDESDESDLVDLGFVTPIQVGDFHLDFGAEQRMKAQFLLCEVQRLGQVLDLFGAQAMSRMQPDGTEKTAGRLPTPAVHQFLTVSLHQLTTAMKEYCVS